jgi:CubicO group peptidase (beta-lactamase class C family)
MPRTVGALGVPRSFPDNVMLCLLRASSAFFCGIGIAVAAPAAPPGPPRDLDAVVARAMREFEVPGLALAVVKDGRAVVLKGYGVRRLGSSTPVDAETLFAIASNTKAFTAAALAMLVDEGKIAWDDPVVRHLPSFQLYDPYVTREITIRDLLTHRSGLGLGAGDLLVFPDSTYTSDEIVARLRFIKPATSFRSRYAYDNLLYLVAGQIIPAVTGKSWGDFVQERIFVPLGMTASNTSVTALRPDGNVATPHGRVEGRMQAVRYSNVDNAAPVGAINSSAAEMARWVMAQLDHGLSRDATGRETRLFSKEAGTEMWSSQTILPIEDPRRGLEMLRPSFSTYGLGWNLRDYRGKKLVGHTGLLSGMASRVQLVPDIQLGIVILTNQENDTVHRALMLTLVDHYLGGPATDWIGKLAAADREEQAKAEGTVQTAAGRRVAEARPSLPLEKYAGRYVDAWYGDVAIALEGASLVLRFGRTPGLVGDLEPWQYDTFVARWRDRSLNADAYVTFALKPDGSIDQMKMAPVSPLTDFSFDFQDLLFAPAPPAANAKADP